MLVISWVAMYWRWMMINGVAILVESMSGYFFLYIAIGQVCRNQEPGTSSQFPEILLKAVSFRG
jgi:hypothetical protein